MWSLPQRFLRHFHGKPAFFAAERRFMTALGDHGTGIDQIFYISEYLWQLTRPKIFHICMYIHNYNCINTCICIRNNGGWTSESWGTQFISRVDWPPRPWPDPAGKSSLLSLSRLIMHRMYGKSVLEGICCRCLPFHSCGMILCISGSSAWPITWFIHCASP